MMRITLSAVAVSVSAAGGLGFIAAGFDVRESLARELDAARALCERDPTLNAWMTENDGILPVGVGFQNWGCDFEEAMKILRKWKVCAVWFFGAAETEDYGRWVDGVKGIDGRIQIWVQVGAVEEAVGVCQAVRPDVLVLQGADAGGHGLGGRAGIMTLLPEVVERLREQGLRKDEEDKPALVAAGGIVNGRGMAAVLALGAQGAALGTRMLACQEAVIAPGYQKEILRARDGGINTVKTKVYDAVRGITGWPKKYDARGLANQTHFDAMAGMGVEENKERYDQEVRKGDEGWGPQGRMTTYAGTAVGLVKEVKSAREILENVRKEAVEVLERTARRFRKWTEKEWQEE